MTSRFALLPLVSLFTACFSGPGYIAKDDGDRIRVQSAAFIPVSDQSGRMYAGKLMLSDKPDLCRSLRSGRVPKKMEGMTFDILRVSNQSVLAPDTGDYTIITGEPQRAGSYASGGFVKLDSNCINTLSANEAILRSGFLTLDEFETGRDGVVSGTFEATYGQGDDTTGRFTAEFCELSVSELNCQ